MNEVERIATAKVVRSEESEVRLILDAASRINFDIVKLSQPQRAMMTPGVPDLRFRHRKHRVTFWFEAKAENGKLTAEQHAFLLAELESGELAACGTLEDFMRVQVAVFRSGSKAADALVVCKHIVDGWARKGYRSTKSTRARHTPTGGTMHP